MDAKTPACFDAAVVESVAAETDRTVDEVAGALGAVQRVVSNYGSLSVDDVVYEWRSQFHQDPLVAQTPTAYYLDVQEHVWEDVGARAEICNGELAGVRRVHAAQFGSDVGDEPPAGAMVLAKE
jgi:muconolactone delta-isomerase